MIDEYKALALTAQGEGQHVEFKESVPLSRILWMPFSPPSPASSTPLSVQGHDIWVIEVPEGDNKPYVASGSIFVRRGANSQKLRTPAEMRQLFDDAGALHFDEAFNKWFRMDLVEKVGSGIPRMADLMKEAGLPAPEYRTEGFFTTVLYKNKNTVKETGKKTIKKTGKKTPQRILEIIKANPQITVSDIAEQCGLTYNGAYYHIEKMREKGILEHKGGDKGDEWIIL